MAPSPKSSSLSYWREPQPSLWGAPTEAVISQRSRHEHYSCKGCVLAISFGITGYSEKVLKKGEWFLRWIPVMTGRPFQYLKPNSSHRNDTPHNVKTPSCYNNVHNLFQPSHTTLSELSVPSRTEYKKGWHHRPAEFILHTPDVCDFELSLTWPCW